MSTKPARTNNEQTPDAGHPRHGPGAFLRWVGITGRSRDLTDLQEHYAEWDRRGRPTPHSSDQEGSR